MFLTSSASSGNSAILYVITYLAIFLIPLTVAIIAIVHDKKKKSKAGK